MNSANTPTYWIVEKTKAQVTGTDNGQSTIAIDIVDVFVRCQSFGNGSIQSNKVVQFGIELSSYGMEPKHTSTLKKETFPTSKTNNNNNNKASNMRNMGTFVQTDCICARLRRRTREIPYTLEY